MVEGVERGPSASVPRGFEVRHALTWRHLRCLPFPSASRSVKEPHWTRRRPFWRGDSGPALARSLTGSLARQPWLELGLWYSAPRERDGKKPDYTKASLSRGGDDPQRRDTEGLHLTLVRSSRCATNSPSSSDIHFAEIIFRIYL